MKISENAKKLKGQPMFHILVRAKELESQGKKILHFELGDPDFDTPKNVIEACSNSLNKGETHYTNPRGLLEFRIACADATKISRNFRPNLNQILICPGANSGIFYAIGCIINPGDEVIVSDPCFPTYISAINFFGGKVVKVYLKEENEFRLNSDDVEKAVTNKTKLIIINSPHNPTGSVLKEEEIKRIYDITEKNDIYLLSDEIYSRMIYQDESTYFNSPSKYDSCKKRVILVNGFSKSYAMTGFRLGTVIAPEELIERMSILLETSNSCVSEFIQRSGIEALKGSRSKESINNMMKEFRERRDLMVKGLNWISRGISCINPKGAFYIYLNIKYTGMTDIEFADYMLEEGVACVPGSVFGDSNNYIRFCYANSKENIIKAIEIINNALIKKNLKEMKQFQEDYKNRFPDEYYVNPYNFIDILSDESKEGDIIITDAGSNLTWTMQGWKVKENQKLFSAFGNSPMGYSLPASIGSQFASPNSQVICIIGDGGLKMNINELETIVKHKLPIKIFIMNNHEFGIIKQFQDTWFNSVYTATDKLSGLGDPDFLDIASAYKLPNCKIEGISGLRENIREILNCKTAVLCSVEIKSGEKIKPKLEFGKPIEDPSPLLDREEFKKNMIKPLDEK